MKSIEEAIEVFSNDIFATKLACATIVDARKDYAKCQMQITPSHMNAAGFVMGGAIFTLADFSFGVASNFDNTLTVTLSSNINFLSPAKCNTLTAETKCTKHGKTVCFFDTIITDCNGTLIATVSATGLSKTC